jgi:Fuc2NAc and GlcNAc transferase
MTTTLLFAAIIAASYLGVAAFGAWGRKRNFLDIPNERSSHVDPTPRGGGIVIVAVSLFVYLVSVYFVKQTFSWGYLSGAVIVAGISLLDDIYTITARWRLLAHSAAAILLMVDRGWWNGIYLPDMNVTLDLNATGAVLTFAWIVWLINAYNFMDGIDGIAGVQAVAAAGGWLAVGWMTGSIIAFYLGGALLFSSLGFLIHNWQPAKMFMGDVGSAFLGFSFAAMPLLANTGNPTDALLPVAGILFVWLFVFDTVITFVRRAFRRERVWRAHREHIYQRIVQSGWSHAAVSSLYGLLALVISFAVVAVFADRISETWMIGTVAAVTMALVAIYMLRKNLPAKHAKDTK